MASRPAKKKPKTQAGDPRGTFRCGPVTQSSMIRAAKDNRRKLGTFLRETVEEWLQTNGYEVDEV